MYPTLPFLTLFVEDISGTFAMPHQGCMFKMLIHWLASMQADGTLQHVVDDTGVLEGMLQPINGEEPKEKDDLVRGGSC